ncbi:MAG: radical SAM protein [Eubacterium sp.]|nr:radical SAM protein [Eubacterium sp.]
MEFKEFKLSKYNLVAKYGNKTLVFNSLMNTFTELGELEIENSVNIAHLTESEIKKLIDQGIIIREGVDEDRLTYIKYVETTDSDILHLVILPTLNCNFRCSYCYEDKVGQVMSDETIEHIEEFVKKEIKGVKGVNVSWFGGEPLVAQGIIEKISEKLMSITKFYKKQYFASMTTNGFFLTRDVLKKMLKYNIIHYQITLDGNKEMHDKTRILVDGKGSYDTIVENLRDIRDHVTSRVFNIVIRNNLTKDSMEYFDEFADFLYQEFGHDDRFGFMFRRVGNWGGKEIENMLSNIIEKEDILITKLLGLKYKFNLYNQFMHFDKFPLCYAACKNNYVINPKGQILKCTVDLDNEKNYIADINEKGEIQFNDNYVNWIYAAVGKNISEKCKNCKLYANCFANVCPLVLIRNNAFTPSECNYHDKELIIMYKSHPELFLEL